MVCFLPTICCHGSPCLARFVTWILVSGHGICRYWKIGCAGCVYPEDELMIILRGLGWGFPRSGILEDDCPTRLQLSTVLVQKIDETAFWCMSGRVSEFILWTVTSTYFLPNSSAWGLTEDSKELWIATTTRIRLNRVSSLRSRKLCLIRVTFRPTSYYRRSICRLCNQI